MLISICIPVRNRIEFLPKTIANIISIFGSYLGSEIEICLVDGGSNDGTQNYLEDLKASPGFQIKLKHENGGVDLDYFEAIELAKGDFVWLFSSDDLLQTVTKESLTKCVELANQNHTELILVGRREIFLNKIRNLHALNRRAPADQQAVYQGVESYIANSSGLLSLFSYAPSIIVSRKQYLMVAKRLKIERFFGTCYAHAPIVTELLKQSRGLILAPDYIDCLIGNDSFSANGYADRILLDYRGYSHFLHLSRDDLRWQQWIIRCMKKEHGFFRILKFVVYSKNMNQVRELNQHLTIFNYPIHIRFFITLFLYFRRGCSK